MIVRLGKNKILSLFPLGAGATGGRRSSATPCGQLTHPAMSLTGRYVYPMWGWVNTTYLALRLRYVP